MSTDLHHNPSQRRAEFFCGEIAIDVQGEPQVHAVCHCENCQRRTGNAFGISAYFARSQITAIMGKSNQYHVDAKQSDGHQIRHFCRSCGTTLYWFISTYPDLIGVAGGCFTTPLPEPDRTASNDSRHQWVNLPSDWHTDTDD